MSFATPKRVLASSHLNRLGRLAVPAALGFLLALTTACGGRGSKDPDPVTKPAPPASSAAPGNTGQPDPPPQSDEALPQFRYLMTSLTLNKGGNISISGPQGEAWRGVVFSVNPPFPHGIELIEATGAITGSSKVASPETLYTITATRGDQKVTTTLRLTIRDKPATTEAP